MQLKTAFKFTSNIFQAGAALTYAELSPLSYGEYVYPGWTAPLGFLVAVATVLGKYILVQLHHNYQLNLPIP